MINPYEQYSSVVRKPVYVPKPAVRQYGRVEVSDMQWHMDARGGLAELHRESHNGSSQQTYVSATLPGVVKAWHLHRTQTDRFTVVRGRILLCVCDLMHENPSVYEIIMDADRVPVRVIIPPGVSHGWMNLGQEESWVVNCVSHEYDGTDEFRRPADSGPEDGIPYDWRQRRDG